MTFVSVLIAVLVGGIEALGLIADQLQLKGGLWDIVAIFAGCWLVSALIWKWRGYDDPKAPRDAFDDSVAR